MRVAFLGSGSTGNATVVTSGSTTLLVDCGLSARETRRRMRSVGVDPERVDAVLLTHEHLDHVRGLRAFVGRSDTPIFATRGTASGYWLTTGSLDIEPLVPGEPMRCGEIEVLPFAASHDTAEPVGYVFVGGCGTKAGVLTDSGTIGAEALEALRDCHILGIECNHDAEMLECCAYPRFVKRRIASAIGHLSNEDAASAVEALASDRLGSVVALHVSKFSNLPEMAALAMKNNLRRIGSQADIMVASQEEPCVASLAGGVVRAEV